MKTSTIEIKVIREHLEKMLEAVKNLEKVNVETITCYVSPIVIYGSRKTGEKIIKKYAIPISPEKTEGGFKVIELPNYKGVYLLIYDPNIKKKSKKPRAKE